MYSKIKSRILSLVFGLLCTLLICIVFNQNKQNSVQSSEGLIQSKSLIESTNLQLSNISSNMQMDTDSEIVKRLRNSFIETPSQFPYNLVHPDKTDYSNGQTPFIDSRLNYKENSFFVECGALDGEKGSNTLFFEKTRKWNGILIEADPSNYAMLKSKNRKAFILHACLSITPFPQKMTFNKAYNRGRLMHNEEAKIWMKQQNLKPQFVSVECFPLHLILRALNRTKVDYFSLDVEGDELNVLKTIPFDKITIEMLSVEYIHGGKNKNELQRFMEGKGYQTVLKMQRDDGGVNDFIFKKKNDPIIML